MVMTLSERILLSELSCIAINEVTSSLPIFKIVTSSTEAEPYSLFIALDGRKASGNYYLDEAKSKGAFTLSSKRHDADVYVSDTEAALLEIARLYKSKLKELKHTVAITGSVGKTTAKNVLVKMLSPLYRTHGTEGNYNNFLGVAYTVLTAPSDTEALVIEAGMNHKGELEAISRAIEPTVSVITNIGTAHIGNFGSREAIAEAKAEILIGMKKKLVIIPHGEKLLLKLGCKYTYSTESREADCYIERAEITGQGSRFNARAKRFSVSNARTSLIGEHLLSAIAIALSVLDLIDADAGSIPLLLKNAEYAEQRGSFREAAGYLIFDDTYSASPDATLAVLKRLSMEKSVKSAVLGDMLELGDHTAALHELVGAAVAKYGFKRLFAFGNFAKHYAEGALKGGMSEGSIFINSDPSAPELTASDIMTSCDKGELILVKASHNIEAGRIIECLIKNNGDQYAG